MGSITRRAELDDNLTVFTVVGEADARRTHEIVTPAGSADTTSPLGHQRWDTFSSVD
jgi:hypothetical protein